MALRDKAAFAVGRPDDFGMGALAMVTIGNRQIGIVRLRNGELRAIRNVCPHKGAPICRGIVGGTWPPSQPGDLAFEREGEVLVCPWHGFEYDLHTGEELFQAGRTPLHLYPVEIRDGQVYVTV